MKLEQKSRTVYDYTIPANSRGRWKYCCKRMENAILYHFIQLGNNLGLFIRHPYPDIVAEDFLHCDKEWTLDFCPFCGEKIELVNINPKKKEAA